MRWDRYWYAAGGRVAVAVLRIAIAIAVLWSLHQLEARWHAMAPGGKAHASYRAVGVWMVLGDREPAEMVVSALWVIARVSTIAMLVGASSRISTAISFASFMALAALSYSGVPSWSHQYTPVLGAQLAFLGARGGDVLSVDALIRRWRGLPAHDVPGGYQWSIRLVQLAVALVFVSGMFHKLVGAGFSLRWITTDNLRHQILLRYDVGGIPHPAIVDWLLADDLRYRATAACSMIAQTAPILACIFVTRPIVRAVSAAAFVLETLGLGVVMQYWNLHWLPLVVVFVDWDALLRRAPPSPEVPARRPSRMVRAFVIGFVLYDLVVSFVPQLDQRVNTFPFTGYPMFAKLRVRSPYDEHLPFSTPSAHFELVSDPPIDATILDARYRSAGTTRDRDELRAKVAGILLDTQHRNPGVKIRALRLWVGVLEVPAYPAPAAFAFRPIGVLVEVAADGRAIDKLGAQVGARRYYREDSTEAFVMPVAGWAYAVTTEDEPWVVARR